MEEIIINKLEKKRRPQSPTIHNESNPQMLRLLLLMHHLRQFLLLWNAHCAHPDQEPMANQGLPARDRLQGRCNSHRYGSECSMLSGVRRLHCLRNHAGKESSGVGRGRRGRAGNEVDTVIV